MSDAPIHHITDEDGIVATDPVAKLVLRVKCIYNKLEFKFYKENLLSFGKKGLMFCLQFLEPILFLMRLFLFICMFM